MTTVLSQKGRIVLPVPIRQELDISPGDDFEVLIKEGNTITLRRFSLARFSSPTAFAD